MAEGGFEKGGHSQVMVDVGKPVESRRWCGCSRRHCLFFILVLGAVLFLYNTNIKEMSPNWDHKWWRQYIPFKSHQQNVVHQSSEPAGPEPEPETAVTNSFELPRTENAKGTNATDPSAAPLQQTTKVHQQKIEPPTPVPYVSPGPYLVEYPYEYGFIINEPKKCEEQKPFLVLMVPVAPHNKAHRDIIRSTWGGESSVQGKVVKLFFLLGLQAGEGAERLQGQLLQESKEHQDLIQSDFLDCYKNLTIKTMVMLEWLDSHCCGASYAMKIDSDMFLNVPNLVGMLVNAPKTNYMTGLVARGGVVLRDTKSKWYVPVEIYSHSQYPRYALGLGYILSLDLPKKLVEASRHVKALYIEDVYLGLCMEYLGIPPTDPPSWSYFNVFPVPYSRCGYSRLIATTTHENTDRLGNWKDFKRPGPYC